MQENNSDITMVVSERLVIFRNLASSGTFITIICNNMEVVIAIGTNGLFKIVVLKILFFSLLQFKT